MVEQEIIKEIYSQEELEILLKRPTSNDFCEFRAWVIIDVLIGTGMRAKELRNLNIKDINLEQGYITLNVTKNNEASSLHLVLSEWLQVRSASKGDFVFCNVFREQLQRSVLQTLVKDILYREK